MAVDAEETPAPGFLRWAVGAWLVLVVLQALFSSSPVVTGLYRSLCAVAVLGWCIALATMPRRLRAGRVDTLRWPLDARLRHEPLRHSWTLPLAGAVAFGSGALAEGSPSQGFTAAAFVALAVTAPLTRRRVHEALLTRGATPGDPASSVARHRRRRVRLLVVSTWLFAIGMAVGATEHGRDNLGVAGGVSLSLAGLALLGFVLLFFMTLRRPDPWPLWYREGRPRPKG